MGFYLNTILGRSDSKLHLLLQNISPTSKFGGKLLYCCDLSSDSTVDYWSSISSADGTTTHDNTVPAHAMGIIQMMNHTTHSTFNC